MKRWCGVLFIFVALSVGAQSTNATLSGTVLDPTGARIPNVQVTAQNTQTGVVLTNVTNQYINSGVFSTTLASIDDIEEIRVTTSPVDAEFGRGTGQVELLSRSGTNEFHGNLREFHRNTALDANNWFNNLRGDPRDTLIWNQFGGGLGGPIRRQRTFFYVTYEGVRIHTAEAVTASTYTETAVQCSIRFVSGVYNGT